MIAARAFDVAHELAARLSAELALVHVVDPAVATAAGETISLEGLGPLTVDEARHFLAGVRSRAGAGVPGADLVGLGRPAAEIVRLARDWPADLVVLGTHGRGPVRRALLGSVADGVVRHAPCPVLVVPSVE